MQVWIPYLATALLVADLIFMLVGSGSVSHERLTDSI
jgi:hypothetical protein